MDGAGGHGETRSRWAKLLVSPAVAGAVVGQVWDHPANRGQRLRSVARAVWFQLSGRAFGRPTVVRLGRRSRVWARLNGAASRRAAYANPPDHPEMLVWQRVLAEGDLFVDVGANVGLYTLWALDCGAATVSVEPLPANLAELRDNLALNDYTSEIHEVALAEADGALWLDGVDPNMQRLVDAPGFSSGGAGRTEVAVRRLDDVLGARRVAGLKIDVEGAERRVLAGAPRALAERRIALVQLEWNDTCERNFGETREPLAALLNDAGYELCRPDDEGVLHPCVSGVGACPEYGADVFARPRPGG